MITINRKKDTLRGRMMLYLCIFIGAALGIVVLLLTLSGTTLHAEKEIQQAFTYQLSHLEENMCQEIDTYTGYGLALGKKAERILENCMEQNSITIEEINDNPELILELEKELYAELNTTIQVGRSSGVFAVLNVTTNTKIPEADWSRSGVYLRLINVSSQVILDPDIIYFRGIPQIAREKGLELHNRWNLEFDIRNVSAYETMMEYNTDDYMWTNRLRLKDTWEDVIFLCVPIRINNQTVGICGVELNATHFQMNYPSQETKFGSMAVTLSPVEDNKILIEKGMTGGIDGTWIQNIKELDYTKGTYYNTYTSEDNVYFGMHKEIHLPGQENNPWAITVLTPKERCADYIYQNKIHLLIGTVGLLIVLLGLSIYLSKRYTNPIIEGLNQMREEKQAPIKTYGIAELDEFLEYMKKRTDETDTPGELPEEIEELFERFMEGVSKLTRAEYNIFTYYIEGYEIAQIPEVAFISMSTVKKHNRNIYEKLGISSYDELMLYIELFRRCKRLEKLVEK